VTEEVVRDSEQEPVDAGAVRPAEPDIPDHLAGPPTPDAPNPVAQSASDQPTVEDVAQDAIPSQSGEAPPPSAVETENPDRLEPAPVSEPVLTEREEEESSEEPAPASPPQPASGEGVSPTPSSEQSPSEPTTEGEGASSSPSAPAGTAPSTPSSPQGDGSEGETQTTEQAEAQREVAQPFEGDPPQE
jgi:hypothetical protein